MQPPNALECSLTVVPPGPVSDRIRVEVRAWVCSRGPKKRTTEVVFLRVTGGHEHLIRREPVTVLPDGASLARCWWPTAGHGGEHSLRVRVREAGRAIGQKDWPLQVIPSGTRALPILQAGWLDLLGMGTSYPRNREAAEPDVRRVLDVMPHIGMRTAIVTYVEYFGRFFYPSRLRFHDRDVGKVAGGQWYSFDVLEAVLAQADRNGMHVFLGLGRGGDTQLLWGGTREPERLQEGIRLSKQVAAELWERYGRHPSFYGWYLTHEMNDLAAASAYYDPVADFCHSLSPDKPVMVAPAGTPVISREVLRRSHVDIFAYQDAVGAGYRPYEYTYKPETRLAVLDQVYSTYRAWHQGSGKHLWADLELWQMDGPEYANAYPPAWQRVRRQIEMEAPHVEMLTGYEVLGFLQRPGEPWRLLDRRAKDLYRSYEAYHGSFLRTRGLPSRQGGAPARPN